MFKKILLIVFILFALGLYLFISSKQETKILKAGDLSERSKEYVQSQKANENQNWRYTNIDKPTQAMVTSYSDSVSNDCFTIMIPFRIINQREEGLCSFYLQLINPKADIMVYEREVSISSIDEESGVSMRRHSKDLYKEATIDVKGKQFLIFKNLEKGYEKTVFYLHGNRLFILNIEVKEELDKADEKLQRMLETVEFD